MSVAITIRYCMAASVNENNPAINNRNRQTHSQFSNLVNLSVFYSPSASYLFFFLFRLNRIALERSDFSGYSRTPRKRSDLSALQQMVEE